MSKIGIKFIIYCLLVVGVLFTGTIFAVAIDYSCFCTMFENVEIDNYRVLVQYNSGFYEPEKNLCIECGVKSYQKVFLLDKSINIKDITEDNVDNMAIYLGSIVSRSESSVSHSIRIKNTTKIYEILNKGNKYTIDLSGVYMKSMSKDFLFFRALFVTLEMTILFLISKFFGKEEKNVGKKIIVGGIIPIIITFLLLHLYGTCFYGTGLVRYGGGFNSYMRVFGDDIRVYYYKVFLRYFAKKINYCLCSV